MSTTLYFVRGDVPPYAQSTRILLRAEPLSGIPGFLFPAQYKDAVREALAWSSHEVKELITSEWGVKELVCSEKTTLPRPGVRIECAEHPSSSWWGYLEEVKRYCESHLPPLPVVIHYASGDHPVHEHGYLHLCFGGHANFPVQVQKHERDIAYCSAHFWVGELGPEHAHCRALIPTLLSEFLPRIMGETPAHCQDEFVASLQECFDAEQESLTSQIAKQRNVVEKLQEQLVAALRILGNLESRYGAMVTMCDQRQQHLRQQYASLARREYIETMYHTKNTITVITERVLIELPGCQETSGSFDIGAFRIDLFTDGRFGCAKFSNLTQRLSSNVPFDSPHPHVCGRGLACLGTISSSLPRLIARHEYAAACDLLINFLRTVNPTDYLGKRITYWPRFSATNGGSS